MRRSSMLVAVLAAMGLGLAAHAAEKSKFGVDVSEWSSDTALSVPDILPIGGAGQVNGDFVTGERNGVQIGIRASRRFLQNIDPLPNDKVKQVNVYVADAGQSSTSPDRATWNYDVHVDLRGARGVAKGTTLGDYTLTLDTDIASTLYGAAVPLDIPALYLGGGFDTTTTELLQFSWNPNFGNAEFDEEAEDTYTFTLTLTPKTFKGPPIEAVMHVEVSD